MPDEMKLSKRVARLTPKVAGNLAGVAVAAAGGPIAPLAVTVAKPVVEDLLSELMQRYSDRQWRKASYVLGQAAKIADITVEEMTARMGEGPEREELLIRTLRAAHACSLDKKLVAFAFALANGADVETDSEVAWEEAFVRALDECDSAHLHLLDKFTQTSSQLGLGQGPDFDTVPDGLNELQVRSVVPAYEDILDTLFALLERHGLVRQHTVSTGAVFSVGAPALYWRITVFGRDFVDRLRVVGISLAPPEADPPAGGAG